MSNVVSLQGWKPPTKCELHKYHWPRPIRLVWHHEQPEAMGGATIRANLIGTCDTGHYNTHQVLGAMVFGKPIPKCTKKEYEAARQGFLAWTAAGKPGNPVAAWG